MARKWQVRAVLVVGLAMIGGGVIRHRLHQGRPRIAWRRGVIGGPVGIVIHHSATPGIVGGRYVGAALIDRCHERRGFAIRYRGKLYHIGYHYVIREDGVIEPGRPEHCPGAHSKTHNNYLGICLVGDFSTQHNSHFWTPSRPTGAQLRALVRLCRRLMAKYEIPPERVVRHCDVWDTACPGDRFPYVWLRQELSTGSSQRVALREGKVQHGDTEARRGQRAGTKNEG